MHNIYHTILKRFFISEFKKNLESHFSYNGYSDCKSKKYLDPKIYRIHTGYILLCDVVLTPLHNDVGGSFTYSTYE